MATLTQVAAMGLAVDVTLDQRWGAALSGQAAAVLGEAYDTQSMSNDDRTSWAKRRTFAWTVLRDPVGVAHASRWVLAVAPLGLIEAFIAGGSAAIADAALVGAADVLWDYLAEA